MGKRRDEKAYHLVCRGNRKRLRQLLGKHVELRTSDNAQLVFAALWHNRGMLRWLLQLGVSPNCRTSDIGDTPLMYAAAHGDLAVIRTLLEFGADPNALSEQSENPLGFAVTWEQPDAIRLLIAAGADVNNTDDSGAGRTQLDIAEISNWLAVADVLRQMGGKRHAELACGG